MRADNRLSKSLEEAFINNDTQYNFGGWAPQKLFPAPISTDGLIFHYDFSNASTMDFRNSGGINYVETIRDLSPNNYDITQSITAYQPIYTADTLGNPCVYFDGIDDIMGYNNPQTDTSLVGFTAMTFFSVSQMPSFSAGTNSYLGGFFSPSLISQPSVQRFLSFQNQMILPYSALTPSNSNLLYYTRVSQAGFKDAKINDVSMTSLTNFWVIAGVITFGGLYVGAGNPPNSPKNLYAKEYILYNRILTELERDNIISYLKSKWNYFAW
jgi:hypothetical protein